MPLTAVASFAEDTRLDASRSGPFEILFVHEGRLNPPEERRARGRPDKRGAHRITVAEWLVIRWGGWTAGSGRYD